MRCLSTFVNRVFWARHPVGESRTISPMEPVTRALVASLLGEVNEGGEPVQMHDVQGPPAVQPGLPDPRVALGLLPPESARARYCLAPGPGELYSFPPDVGRHVRHDAVRRVRFRIPLVE